MHTQVCIIGGGVTGTGLARDLALRGIYSILVEMRDLNAGASGGNHGLLHSGARYVASDPISAFECQEENKLLKGLAAHCIEDTGGLYIAVKGDNQDYIENFPAKCAQAGVYCQSISVNEALELEPQLSQETIAAFYVQDATIDPFKISLDNLSEAINLGCTYLSGHEVVGFKNRPDKETSIVHLKDHKQNKTVGVQAQIVVNASGAWAKKIASLAGSELDMAYSKGTLAVSHKRITQRVINRLREPDDGDILVPGGTVSILGTTSIRIPSLKDIQPCIGEIDRIIDEGSCMLPVLEKTRYIRSYAGVRAIIKSSAEESDRFASRGYTLIDHGNEGLENFITITGGKLTTFRLMAEKTADLVSKKLGCQEPCLTRSKPLSSTAGKWTEPGLSPKEWFKKADPEDLLLCECEMVPQSNFDQVLNHLQNHGVPSELNSLRLRSRMGKGACQGTFCSFRLANYLVDKDYYQADQGLAETKKFLRTRWIGQRPVLWNGQLAQAELAEAIYCGLLGLELSDSNALGNGP